MENTCSCMAKGRLLIHVESEVATSVRIMILEQSGYRDMYMLTLNDGSGEVRIDSIAMGKVTIETNIDGKDTIYYPSNVILFQSNDYIHKLNIIDRRKKSEKL